ncbi:MAG: hypothetical protein LAO20_00990 [Acidobacteriia bacterium]|nr:hypothetical protein [Terriglobia bacterium]
MSSAKPHSRTLILACLLLAALPCCVAVSAVAQKETPTHQVASVLARPSVEPALELAFRDMYNLEFDAALRKTEEAKALDAQDPTPWMAQACAVLFREFNRLHILTSEMFASDEKFDARPVQTWDAASKKQFDEAASAAEKIAQKRLDRDKNDEKALFVLTMVNGLRADDAALISKKNLAALSYTKAAEGFAERLLARAPEYYDAHIATGMGKYIIGGKAAPVRWMLRLGGLKGDQAEGVRELGLVADHGHYLASFAQILLSFDDLRHKNTTSARKRLSALHNQFPNNPLFVQEMAKLDQPAAGAGH